MKLHKGFIASFFLAFCAITAAWMVAGLFGASIAKADSDTSATSTAAVATSTTGTSTSSVASAPAPVDACAPTKDQITQIAAIQNNPNLSYSEELQQELALRKQLLGATINCAESEATDLQSSLNAITATNDTANLQSELSGKLSDAVNFYNI